MQGDQSDLELIFKKRARRRLVGAIALVLLMITLLPVLLKDRALSNTSQEIAIVISNETFPDNAPTEINDNTPTDIVIAPEKPDAIEPPEKMAKLDSQVTANQPKETTKIVDEPITDIKVKPVIDATKVPSQNVSNQFYVQIGVFSDPENVKKLQLKLDELGYQSVIEKLTTETGEKTRLRTTTFVGKNDAIIALENIKDAGLTGMVVSQK